MKFISMMLPILILLCATCGAANRPFVFRSATLGRSKRDTLSDSVRQLEQFVQFVNGLILTEALAERVVNVSTITTDFLLLGRMSSAHLESMKFDKNQNADLEKRYEEMLPELWEIIENGRNISDVTADEMSDAINAITSGIIATNKIRSSIESLKNLEEQHEKTMNLEISIHKDGIPVLLGLPLVMKKLQNRKDSDKFIDLIPEAMKVSYEAFNGEVSNRLNEAVKQYKEYFNATFDINKQNALQVSLYHLKESIINFSFDKVTYEVAEYLNDLLELRRLFEKAAAIQPLYKDSIFKMNEALSKLNNTVIERIARKDVESFSKMASSLNWFKTSDTSEINSVFRVLAPLAAISREFLPKTSSNGQANTSEQSFVERFKSYSGFGQGIVSFKNMADGLVPAFTIPERFTSSPISYRSVIIQNLAEKLKSYCQFSNGLQNVDRILNVSEFVGTFAKNISVGFNVDFSSFEELSKNLPNIQKLADVVAHFVFSVQYSKDKKWEEKLKELADKLPNDENYLKMNNLLSSLPQFIDFATTARDVLGNYLLETPYEKWNNTELKAPFERMGDLIGTIGNITNIIENKELTPIDKNLEGLKTENLKTLNDSLLFKEWEEIQFDTSAEEILSIPAEFGKIKNVMNGLAGNMANMTNTIAKLIELEPLNSVGNNSLDGDSIRTSMMLLRAVINPTHRNFQFVDKPSDGIALLMVGSPFGADVLKDLSSGLLAYRSLFDGIQSTEKVKEQAAILKGIHSNLSIQLENLLDGVKIMEVFQGPYSPNALQSLETIPLVIDRITSAEKWMSSLIGKKLGSTVKELHGLTTSSSDPKVKRATVTLHSFISQLNDSTAQNFNKLKNGLSRVVKAFSFVNCTKTPSHASCHVEITSSTPKSNAIKNKLTQLTAEESVANENKVLIIGGLSAIVLLILCVVGFVVGLSFMKNKKNKNNGKNEARKNNVFRTLLQTADVNSKIINGEGRFLVERYLDKDPDLIGVVWAAQFARCEQPKEPLIEMPNFGLGSSVQLTEFNAVRSVLSGGGVQYNANITQLIDNQNWIISQSPIKDSCRNWLFWDMVKQEKVDVIVQLGPEKEEGVAQFIYFDNPKKLNMLDKVVTSTVVSEINNLVHRKLNIGEDEDFVVDHLYYKDWLKDDVPDDLDISLKIIEKCEEITKGKKYGRILVHSQRGTGRSLVLFGIAYVKCIIREQNAMKRGGQFSDARVSEGLMFCELVKCLRSIRNNGFQSVSQYAYLEVMAAKLCAQLSDSKSEELMLKYEKLEEALVEAKKSGNLSTAQLTKEWEQIVNDSSHVEKASEKKKKEGSKEVRNEKKVEKEKKKKDGKNGNGKEDAKVKSKKK